MQKSFLLVCLVVFLTGCTQTLPIDSPRSSHNVCYESPYEQEVFERVLAEEFGLSGYSIVESECSFGRAAQIQATLHVDGQDYSVSYEQGSCSSGGTDCGQDVCIRAVSQDDVVEAVRDIQCAQVTQTQRVSSVCPYGQSVDNTSQAREECRGYITRDGADAVFSLNYVANRCESYVEQGPATC